MMVTILTCIVKTMVNIDILKSNLALVQIVIDYFAAEFTNTSEYERIKESALKHNQKFKNPNGKTFINLGFLSPLECTLFIIDKGIENTGRVIDETIKALEERLIIYPIDKTIGRQITDDRFRLNGEKAAILYRKNLIMNIILGFDYIVQEYKNSVFKIEHVSKNQDHSIGTGFLIDYADRHLIITNKHVIEEHDRLRVLNNEDNSIDFEDPFLHPDKDIAILPLKEKLKTTAFQLETEIRILGEIITIGYPSIPMTRLAYQVYHRGEINSFVQDYYGNQLFLISAKTSAGNSGSPVIDNKGTVVGIVTEELFEKEQFYKKGKLPYYAAITSNDIFETINNYRNFG